MVEKLIYNKKKEVRDSNQREINEGKTISFCPKLLAITVNMCKTKPT